MDTQPLVLIVDDEIAILETLQGALQDEGYQVRTLPDGGKVLDAVGRYIPDLILLDIFLPHHNGIALLESIKKEFPQQQVMMISGFGNIQMALDAVSKGALDFIEKPLSLFDILPKIEFIKKKGRRQKSALPLDSAAAFGIIGRSFLFKELIYHVEQIACLSFPLLVYGASGTGKMLFAKYIHSKNNTTSRAPIIVNCCQETMLDFDDYKQGDTLILSHIDTLCPTQQQRLAAFIEENTPVRIIATTTKPVAMMALQDAFNRDLFYKLNVVPIEVPSLEKRQFDIPLLVNDFLVHANHIYTKQIIIAPSGIRFLRNYHWNENVRELKIFVHTLVEETQDPFTIVDGEMLEVFVVKSSLTIKNHCSNDMYKNDYDQHKFFVTLKTDSAANG